MRDDCEPSKVSLWGMAVVAHHIRERNQVIRDPVRRLLDAAQRVTKKGGA